MLQRRLLVPARRSLPSEAARSWNLEGRIRMTTRRDLVSTRGSPTRRVSIRRGIWIRHQRERPGWKWRLEMSSVG